MNTPATPASTAAPKSSGSRGKLAGYAVLGLAALALLVFGGRSAAAYVPQFAAWVDGLGVLGPVVFILLGATLGASLAFLVARYLARGAIERRIAGNPRFAAIDRAVGREGFKIVALLRLSPIFPFNLLNYSLGLTKVRFLHYFAASIAMLPGTLLYVYYGAAAGSLASAVGGKTEKGTGDWVVLGLGLLATVVVTTYVTRLAGKALRQEIGPEDHHV